MSVHMLKIDYICKFSQNWVSTTPLCHLSSVCLLLSWRYHQWSKLRLLVWQTIRDFLLTSVTHWPLLQELLLRYVLYSEFHFFCIVLAYHPLIVSSYGEIQWDIIYRVPILSSGTTFWCALWRYTPLKSTSSMCVWGTCKPSTLCPRIISIATTIGECGQSTIHCI